MPIQTKVIIICSIGLHNTCAGKISCVLFNYIDYEYVFRVWLQAHRYISKQSAIILNNPPTKPIDNTSVPFLLKPDLMREITLSSLGETLYAGDINEMFCQVFASEHFKCQVVVRCTLFNSIIMLRMIISGNVHPGLISWGKGINEGTSQE